MGRRRRGRDITGWINLDKPLGFGSTPAVSKVRRVFDAKKAGHAGTLDPLASGILPVALGEATKTVQYMQNASKVYHVTIAWGAATRTDDLEGEVTETATHRPQPADIAAGQHFLPFAKTARAPMTLRGPERWSISLRDRCASMPLPC